MQFTVLVSVKSLLISYPRMRPKCCHRSVQFQPLASFIVSYAICLQNHQLQAASNSAFIHRFLDPRFIFGTLCVQMRAYLIVIYSLSLQTNRLTLAVSCNWTDFCPPSSRVQCTCMHCLGDPYRRGHICKRYRKHQLPESQSLDIFTPWSWANNLIVTACLTLLLIYTYYSINIEFLLTHTNIMTSHLFTFLFNPIKRNPSIHFLYSISISQAPLFSPFLPMFVVTSSLTLELFNLHISYQNVFLYLANSSFLLSHNPYVLPNVALYLYWRWNVRIDTSKAQFPSFR